MVVKAHPLFLERIEPFGQRFASQKPEVITDRLAEEPIAEEWASPFQETALGGEGSAERNAPQGYPPAFAILGLGHCARQGVRVHGLDGVVFVAAIEAAGACGKAAGSEEGGAVGTESAEPRDIPPKESVQGVLRSNVGGECPAAESAAQGFTS